MGNIRAGIILLYIILLVGFVSANISLSVDSMTFEDRDGNAISALKEAGEKAIISILVNNLLGNIDLKKVYLSWDSSWVDCGILDEINENETNWNCQFTVTPSMSNSTEIFANVESKTQNSSNISVLILESINKNISVDFINFNGEFVAGTTLFSDWYENVSSFIGKDANPIKENCSVGETYCSKFKFTWGVKYCVKNNSRGRCVHWQRDKTATCARYAERKLCKGVKIRCNNDGKVTNQLSLANFYYTFDGVSWEEVSYEEIDLNGEKVMFKVSIPSFCSPAYDVNSSIMITK